MKPVDETFMIKIDTKMIQKKCRIYMKRIKILIDSFPGILVLFRKTAISRQSLSLFVE